MNIKKIYSDIKEHLGLFSYTERFYTKVDWFVLLATFLVSFVGYLFTLAPDLTLQDSGELAVGSFYAGVPHPPGYPVWTLYTKLFTILLPFSNIAWRVAVSSAFATALSCGIIAMLISRGAFMILSTMGELEKLTAVAKKKICAVSGFVGGMLFGYNGFVWSQSVIVEVYTLSVLSFVTVLVFMLRWIVAPKQRIYLYLAMFVFGICFTNHQSLLVAAMGLEVMIILAAPVLGREMLLGNSIIFMVGLIGGLSGMISNLNPSKAIFKVFIAVGVCSIIGYIILVLKNKYCKKEVLQNVITVVSSAVCWVLGTLFYFYMPITSMTNPPMNWGYARTVNGFFHALTRGQYEDVKPTSDLLAFFDQIRVYMLGAMDEFTLVILFLALVPFILIFFRTMSAKQKKRIVILSSCYAAIFLLGLLYSVTRPDIQSDTNYAGSPWTYVGFLAGWIILLISSVPFVFHKDVDGKPDRIWIAGTTSGFFCLAIILLILLNPTPDKQSQDLNKVFFTSSYIFLAMWVGYGISLLLGLLVTQYEKYREYVIYGGAVSTGLALYALTATLSDSSNTLFIVTAILGLGMTAALVVFLLFNRQNVPFNALLAICLIMPVYTMMAHWWENEQRGHLFGFWYGHDMFTPPFNGKDGKPLYPEMSKDAILFGGTDPGRFCPTYMIFCESFIPSEKRRDPNFDRRDVYIITQNALPDVPYLDYIRAQYFPSAQVNPPFFQNLFGTKLFAGIDNIFEKIGARIEASRRARGVYPEKEIYTPSTNDFSNKCAEFMQDFYERYQKGDLRMGEYVDAAGRPSGQGVVMGIAGLMAKQIFEKNPEHDFYVEESFPLDWMYPLLTPYGIIFKINREPVTLTPGILNTDHEFWTQYADRLCGNWITYDTPIEEICDFVKKTYLRGDFKNYKGDIKFVRDDDAQKAFSKLRSAIGGLFYWHLANNPGDPIRQSLLLKETEFAYKQAYAFCPFSPEALLKLVNLLVSQHRFDDAERLVMTSIEFDIENKGFIDTLYKVRELRLQTEKQLANQNVQLQEHVYLSDSNNVSNAVALVKSYLDLGDAEKAQLLLQDFLPRLQKMNEENPTNLENALYLFTLYTELKQNVQSKDVINRLLQQENPSLETLVAAAGCVLQLGEIEETEKILSIAGKMAPTNAEIIYDLAAMQAMLGKNEEALANLNQAVFLNKKEKEKSPKTRDLFQIIQVDKRFESLKNDPSFPKP